MVTLDQIRARLIASIRESGLTQTEIAKRIGIRQATVSEYFHGKSMPALDTLANLCAVLDISADYLLGGSDYLGNVSAGHFAPTLTDAEEEVLRLFRGLTQGRRDDLLIYLRALAGAGGKSALPKKA